MRSSISAATKATIGDRSREAVLPSAAPMPVRSIQAPKTMPTHHPISASAQQLAHERQFVKNADRPRQQTASGKERIGATGREP